MRSVILLPWVNAPPNIRDHQEFPPRMSGPSPSTDVNQALQSPIDRREPPIARRDPTPTTLHGVTLQDDYRWMRDKDSPELLAHLNAENAYTAAFMAPTA